jgi:hypothetical protein
MQGSKIRLSPAEAALFSDAQMILTKNSIIQKTAALLTDIQAIIYNQSPPAIQTISPSPKISKGENYLGLPYVILDYPRIAKGNDLFFIRNMFWWGNFFSSTLQVSGEYKSSYGNKLLGAFQHLQQQNYYVGINADPWVHHFEKDNYRQINGLSKEAFALLLEESQHIKIAACWPLSEWDSAANKLVESYKFLTGLIS